jgi:hypothetical protein
MRLRESGIELFVVRQLALKNVLWGSQSWLQPAFSRLSHLADASVLAA